MNEFKKYKRSFLKCITTRMVLLPMLIMALFCSLIIIKLISYLISIGIEPSHKLVILVTLPPLLFVIIFGFTMKYFYISFEDDGFTVANGIFPFVNKSYKYTEVEGCILGNAGGYSLDYFQIIRNGKGSWKYVIDMVSPRDYSAIIEKFKDHGIHIVKKGKLDRF